MLTLNLLRGVLFVALSTAIVGCASAYKNEDSLLFDCATYSGTFFNKSTSEQINSFGDLDTHTQYEVFICGNQMREPPALHLIKPFANEGASVVGYLESKLSNSHGELTINDIISIFAQMSRDGSYDIAGDKGLMKTINSAVSRLSHPYWKERGERLVNEIDDNSKDI